MVSTAITRPASLVVRFMQWSSAVIVMGITSYFINKWPHTQHTIYWEVISTMSVVFFLPAFLSPFMPTRLSRFVLPIDVIFSYLWLTAFIFAAQDYNWHNCAVNAPPGASCALKKANESFIFLAFIFTFFAIGLEVMNLWAARQETSTHEKHSDANRAPLDAPANP
ncbi:hypothetical protein KXX16_001618 [Aspergillus fumigatus]|uniref:MARVEL domain-containing protein n=1 Tax=Aspergillus fumigatus TaxID=746128 RepID=A0A9P8NEL3_ASPFM|nr:hypothetical protein KXX38_002120 [Aspergillus fumigatus]KAH1390749.1 hypothetical protein KXX49_002742 [Aspergillus fumigatus]KAH1418876.1 hypothetical protein KXX64_002046 [Aspergillus fumigatus]KAH1453915.1 hypothetical protein KXX58_002006 [Aspergillus fumigatus]KAH1616532.1 hypothetical protein KXX31_001632 [Aspergillus fumigatus]